MYGFDEFLRDGLQRFYGNPRKRRRGGQLVPRLVADQLARTPEPEQMQAWNARVCEHWQHARARQGGDTESGWPELLAGVLIAIELLDSQSLPALGSYEKAITDVYQRERVRFRRYALLVGRACRAVRVLLEDASPEQLAQDRFTQPVEKALSWRLMDADRPAAESLELGRMLFGRSHTLMLGICALERRGLIPDLPDRPLAATGELVDSLSDILDGQGGIGPVGSFADKARTWFAAHPDGVLLAAPPVDLDRDAWRSIILFENKPYRAEMREPDMNQKDVRHRLWQRWLSAASLVEMRAKLALQFGTGGAEIRGWDGQALTAERIAPLTLQWANGADRPEKDWRVSADDRLIDALWLASRNAQRGAGSRGVLVEGAPGAGKSLWARQLERRCATGPLGALGYAAYYPARAFAESIESGLDPLRADDDHERAGLLERLRADGRLIAVVDGLDELEPRARERVGTWLVTSGLRFVVTSRPLEAIRESLGLSIRLTIKPLDSEQAAALLIAHGREKLARQLFGKNLNTSPGGGLAGFCDRPFPLSLLMRAVTPSDDVHDIDEAELYRRTYRTLIRQARQSERLSAEQATMLAQSPGELLGELAILWLRGGYAFIRDAQLSAVLAEHGYGPREGVDIRRALEFGYLLAPASDSWEFVHRTLAEWAAAQALEHRVSRRLLERGLDDEDVEAMSPDQRATVADIEMDEIGWLLERDLEQRHSWYQILRFYIPLCRTPEMLFRTMIGPGIREKLEQVRASVQEWDDKHRYVDEHALRWLIGQFRVAVALMTHARWRDGVDGARRCWEVIVRIALLPAGWRPGLRFPLVYTFEHPLEWKYWISEGMFSRWARSLQWVVPGDLDGLVELAARTPEQCAYFEEKPTALLPACARRSRFAFAELGRHGSPAQQLAIFDWKAKLRDHEYDEFRDGDELDHLARTIPDRIHAISVAPKSWEEYETGRKDTYLLERLESLVYQRVRELEYHISWPVLRRRLQDWPSHLDKELEKWFARAGREGHEPRYMLESERRRLHPLGDPIERRKDALRLFLAETVEAHRRVLAYKPHLRKLLETHRERLYERDVAKHTIQNMAEWFPTWPGPADRHPWGSRYSRLWHAAGGPAELPEPDMEFYGHEGALQDGRKRLHTIVESLAESLAYEQVVGELWTAVPEDSIESIELFGAIEHARRLPSQIPVVNMLSRLPDDAKRLPKMWHPSSENPGWWQQEHERQWRELSVRGGGRERFLALCWCAMRDGRKEVDVLAVSMHDDLALEALLLEWWAAWHLSDEDYRRLPPVYLTDATRMPLAYQAHHDIPGWRDRLLAVLRTPDDDDFEDIVRLASKYSIRSALPLLVSAWRSHEVLEPDRPTSVRNVHIDPSTGNVREWVEVTEPGYADRRTRVLLSAIRTLLDPDQPEHRSLFAEIPVESWFYRTLHRAEEWQQVGRLLTLQDLPRLLQAPSPPTGHFSRSRNERPLTPYWQSLGPAGHATVMDALREHREQLAGHRTGEHDDAERARRREEGLAGWIEELQYAAIVTGVEQEAHSDELIELGFTVIAAQSDEPGSHAAARLLLDECTRRTADGCESALTQVERWLEHPMSALQEFAFHHCVEHTPTHGHGALVMRAMESHLRCAREYGSTDVAMQLLASSTDSSLPFEKPSSDINSWQLGRFRQDLLAMGLRYLSSLHRPALLEWLASTRPELRYLACYWLGRIGPLGWSSDIRPLIDDPHPAVMCAALQAWLYLRPGSLQYVLDRVSRDHWHAEHYTLLFHLWLSAPREPQGVENPGELQIQLVGELLTTAVTSSELTRLGTYALVATTDSSDTEKPSLAENMLIDAARQLPLDAMYSAMSDLLASQTQAATESFPERAPFLTRVRTRWLQNTELASDPTDGVAADEARPQSTDADGDAPLGDESRIQSPTVRLEAFLTHLFSDVYPPEWSDEQPGDEQPQEE